MAAVLALSAESGRGGLRGSRYGDGGCRSPANFQYCDQTVISVPKSCGGEGGRKSCERVAARRKVVIAAGKRALPLRANAAGARGGGGGNLAGLKLAEAVFFQLRPISVGSFSPVPVKCVGR